MSQEKKAGKRKPKIATADKRQLKVWHLLIMLAVDAYLFWMTEIINNPELGEMKPYFMMLNILGIFVMNLLALLWFNSLERSLILIICVFSGMAIVFYYVYAFRGSPLLFIDFLSMRTAFSVAGDYKPDFPKPVILDAVVWIISIIVLMHVPEHVLIRKSKMGRILMRVGAASIMIVMYPIYLNVNWNGALGVMTDLYRPHETYMEYGTNLGFFCEAKYMRLTPPEGYSVAKTKKIMEDSEKETARDPVPETTNVKPVNIIAIMNESWADYRYAGDLETTREVMPFYDSLSENTIKGHTQVCITGGGTAKTEYEFLTGNTMKPYPGMVPYSSYFTHDEYSVVSTLKSQGYRAVAMHPNKGTNWNRSSAYGLMGFDKFYTEDDFDADVLRYRGHISDQANYEKIIDVVESKKDASDPLFLFDVTMQNHGGYNDGADVKKDVQPIGYNGTSTDRDAVNTYLSLERLSDDALQELIEYFEKCDQPTIVVMFGDHYPHLPDSFVDYVTGRPEATMTLAEEERLYATPFFIWANYDIPEQSDVLTSTNYLSTIMLQQTGLQMTPYNGFLYHRMQDITAMNHLGYRTAAGRWFSWKDADAAHDQEEWNYESIVYNNLGPEMNRQDDFFTIKKRNP